MQAASRTDRGVHAAGQIISFATTKRPLCENLLISLNQLLPKEIAVKKVEYAHDDFHATLMATGKTYIYELTQAPWQFPQRRFFEWHYPHPLDIGKMRACVPHLTGTRDFKAFTNAKKNETYEDTMRTVDSIEIEQQGDLFLFRITGTRFLYKMVRNLVGLLVYAGCGKIEVDQVPVIMEKQDRSLAGITAPAHGLTLEQVFYTKI